MLVGQRGHVDFLFVFRNFEESEDELRGAVADSMKNLLLLEDRSSDEEEEAGGAVRTADRRHIQPEVQEAPSDATAGLPGPSEEGDGDTEQ